MCKQKTAYEMRMSDWSSDVCSSDLVVLYAKRSAAIPVNVARYCTEKWIASTVRMLTDIRERGDWMGYQQHIRLAQRCSRYPDSVSLGFRPEFRVKFRRYGWYRSAPWPLAFRSEEHTSELQSIMRISYAVFCL